METKFFKKGTILFREGEESLEMYYIESGSVAILCKGDTTGENVPVNIIGKGNFVGEFAFFDEKPRSATVMMVEDTKLKVIDRHVLKSIGKNGIFIIQALINKMRSMNNNIVTSQQSDDDKAA
ncbi:MAG: cyclic nucleotide-binding domain-containing protein [Halobacteriovoraceae bacterium]|nr:cyclic nucleotide-binding domain-containing protein [Halobacteriovoraceae bacterium]